MKIALVIERFNPAAGGNERSTDQIARRLIERGHDVTVLTSKHPTTVDLPGGRIVSSDGLRTKSALGLLRFARWAEKQLDDYDVSLSVTLAVPAHVLQPRSGTVRETLARNVARRRGATRRALKQLGIALSPKQLALLYTERRSLNHPRVQRIVAISRYVGDQLFHHYTIPPKRLDFIPNAAAVERLGPGERAELRQKVRNTWQLDDDDIVYLFAAMNPGLKGLGSLIDALPTVVQVQPRAKLVVAGCLPQGTIDRAAQLGLSDHVRWVGPTRQLDTLYAASDVTVLPSWYDPSSKVVIESLLHGVPAISTAYNGASQWVADPADGNALPSPLSSPMNNPITYARQPAGRVIRSPRRIDELAQAMIDLADPSERRRCAAAAHDAQLDQRLGMDRHVDDLERVLTEAAGNAAGAKR